MGGCFRMKKEFLQPFLKAAEDITVEFFGLNVEKSSISLEKTLSMERDVIIALGIKGQISGIALFGTSEEEAIQLSSKVLEKQGMPGYDQWDELAQSALLEFGNTVVGHVTELYGEKDITCDITTPSFIKKEQLKNYGKESVRFEMNNGVATIVVKLHIMKK